MLAALPLKFKAVKCSEVYTPAGQAPGFPGSTPPSAPAGVAWAAGPGHSPQPSGGRAWLLSRPHNSTDVFTQAVCCLKGWNPSAQNYAPTDPHQSLICQIASLARRGEAGGQKCHVFMPWKAL